MAAGVGQAAESVMISVMHLASSLQNPFWAKLFCKQNLPLYCNTIFDWLSSWPAVVCGIELQENWKYLQHGLR